MLPEKCLQRLFFIGAVPLNHMALLGKLLVHVHEQAPCLTGSDTQTSSKWDKFHTLQVGSLRENCGKLIRQHTAYCGCLEAFPYWIAVDTCVCNVCSLHFPRFGKMSRKSPLQDMHSRVSLRQAGVKS